MVKDFLTTATEWLEAVAGVWGGEAAEWVQVAAFGLEPHEPLTGT